MADQSLDDFFAKKDKSKKKTKGKSCGGLSSNEGGGSSASTTQQTLLSSSSSSNSSSIKKTTLGSKKKREDGKPGGPSGMDLDQEWNDYEPDTEKDYSGLRIQNLQIKSEEGDDVENDYNDENDENNEGGERREGHSGPWNKSGQQSSSSTPPVVVKEEEPAPVVEAPPSKTMSGRYVPPGQRGMGSSMTPTEARMARIRNSKKEAPNIDCELDFPTLGGAGGNEPANNMYEDKNFERVRGGNRNYEDPSNNSLQLKLNNKYSALRD